MKSKTFKMGNRPCKVYCKTAGRGYEVCFSWGGKTVFVGNFVHTSEAVAWYAFMNREIRTFAHRFKGTSSLATTPWYNHFLKNHLYKTYYSFLDQVFARHTRTYQKAYSKDLRRYQQWKSKTPTTQFTNNFYRAAA